MRFIHIADVHLDSAYATRSERLRTRLQRASAESFSRCVDVAIRENIDAVLIAGDLLDRPQVSLATERLLLEGFRALADAGVHVIYATGNHDPGREIHSGTLPWPDNVTVASGPQPETVEIVDNEGSVRGHVAAIGHATSHETEDLSARLLPREDTPLPQVGLLHTLVGGAGKAGHHTPYAPSNLDALKRTGFHYWALGHVHRRQALATSPAIHYAGNIQGRGSREMGPKGGLLVDLSDPGVPCVEFMEFATVRWERLVVEGLASAHALEPLAAIVASEWAEARAGLNADEGTEFVVVVTLAGPSPLWHKLRGAGDVEALEEELCDRLGVVAVEVDATRAHPAVRLDQHRARRDILGASLALVQDMIDGSEALGLQESDLAGFAAGRDGSVSAYLARLLDGGAEELVARMVLPVEGGSVQGAARPVNGERKGDA